MWSLHTRPRGTSGTRDHLPPHQAQGPIGDQGPPPSTPGSGAHQGAGTPSLHTKPRGSSGTRSPSLHTRRRGPSENRDALPPHQAPPSTPGAGDHQGPGPPSLPPGPGDHRGPGPPSLHTRLRGPSGTRLPLLPHQAQVCVKGQTPASLRY